MRRNFFLPPLILFLAAGCATAPRQAQSFHPANLFPANAFITQRALFNARGRQFALNGYLALSETGGKRLVVTENFGHIVADVLVKPDGRVFVMQSSGMFPENYIRYGIAADLECIFGDATNKNCPVKVLDANHFVIERGRYKLDLRIVETKYGTQPMELFDEARAEKK
jgi:hypothetical protein